MTCVQSSWYQACRGKLKEVSNRNCVVKTWNRRRGRARINEVIPGSQSSKPASSLPHCFPLSSFIPSRNTGIPSDQLEQHVAYNEICVARPADLFQFSPRVIARSAVRRAARIAAGDTGQPVAAIKCRISIGRMLRSILDVCRTRH